jgi:glycosyltransferase involved in cell wall biosynthesis
VAANSSWNIQNFRLGLVRALIRGGHDVITVTPDPDGVKVDEIELEHRICRIDRTGTNPIHDLASIWRLASIIRQERPDIFLSFTIKPNIYGASICRLLKVPSVPNVSGLGTAFLRHSAFRRAVLHMYRFAFAGTKAIFFQNPDDRDLFLRERVVRADQGRVLPGSGIDLVQFAKAEFPADLRFLMIARLLGPKGVREYVEAARKVKARFPSATFSLLGDLDHGNRTAISEEELRGWVEEGAVEYLGTARDVRPFIRSSSAVVLPSYREGLPHTLLEGAAMGRPLIGTDVPGCRELVRDGLTGFLCEARNADSLAAAMERLAASSHDERMGMGAAARSMAEREYDEAFVHAAYIEVIDELVR